MSEREADWIDRLRGGELSRRDALKSIAGGGLALGGAKAVDNVLIGYGVLTGTNLVEQDLASLAAADLWPKTGFRAGLDGYVIETTEATVRVFEEAGLLAEEPFEALTASTGEDLGAPEPLARALADLGAVTRGEATFEFHRTEAFFDRVRSSTTRPLSIDALRRWPAAEPDVVERFAETDPTDPQALLHGLTAGFRAHTFYDIPRYAAGSIQDNVIFGVADLRAPFREPVDFASISSGPETGLFCYEFTHRSLEALHAVPSTEQVVPVMGARVIDDRHKHVYTAVASLVRDGGNLVVPITFVDYTHTTLYDDLHLRGLVGEGFEAYNRRHMATEIDWDPYA